MSAAFRRNTGEKSSNICAALNPPVLVSMAELKRTKPVTGRAAVMVCMTMNTKPASGPPDTAPRQGSLRERRPNAATARLPGGGLSERDSPSPGFFTHFVPISEAVARVLGRVMRRQRERLDEATIVARHPVTDPEDDAVARAFAEPEIGG